VNRVDLAGSFPGPIVGTIVPKTGMIEIEFRAELAEVRLRCERILAQGPSVEQLVGLGAELHAQTEAILRDLSDKGLMWRPWV
jgi:hypothetical protein